MLSLLRVAGRVALVDANQMYTRCQIQYCSQLSDSVQKLKETSEKKIFEIKTGSGMMCQQKVQKQKFCDSVHYKIPYFKIPVNLDFYM